MRVFRITIYISYVLNFWSWGRRRSQRMMRGGFTKMANSWASLLLSNAFAASALNVRMVRFLVVKMSWRNGTVKTVVYCWSFSSPTCLARHCACSFNFSCSTLHGFTHLLPVTGSVEAGGGSPGEGRNGQDFKGKVWLVHWKSYEGYLEDVQVGAPIFQPFLPTNL